MATTLSIWGAMHWYGYARLVRDPALGLEATGVSVALFIIGAIAVLVAFSRALPSPWAGRVHRLAFTWMGSIFIVDVLLLIGDGMYLAFWAIGGATMFDSLVIARARAAFTSAAAALLLARALLKVVVISDLHVAPGTTPAYVRDIVERTNAVTPDVIALCGDLVDGSVDALADAVRPLGDLRARLGTFAVTGNHEFFAGAPPWVTFLRQIGVVVLENNRRTLGVGDTAFDVAGVPDFMAGRFGGDGAPKLSHTLAGRDITHPVILLAHQPRQFDEAAALGVTLQLSGHTHGGQIWPFTLLVRLIDRRVAGIYRQGKSLLYVSRGVRYWGPPMRLGAPHELSLLTLHAG